MKKLPTILTLILLVSRLFIIYKLISLLYLTQQNPVEYPMDKLTWWSCLLIFDIWLQNVLPSMDKED
jgi:hypothetical protein